MLTNTSTTSTHSAHPTSPRPWWLELTLVDLRHALWPWLAYLVACGLFVGMPGFLDQDSSPIQWIWVNIIILFSVPAIVSAIFTADFNHATAETLLTLPPRRSPIWIARMALLLILVFLPLIMAVLAYSIQNSTYSIFGSQTTVMHVFTMFLVQGLYCFVTFGPLLAVLLRKGLLAWSAIVISPLIIAIVAIIVQEATGIADPDTAANFPYIPPFLFWFIIIVGIPAAVLAWYRWQRLELRS